MSDDKYRSEYSDDSFWDKVKNVAIAAGREIIELALTLYYCAADPDTPTHIKATIYGALGYFISPIDAIPDVTPIVGYSDDLGVLVMAMAAVAAHVRDEHKVRAQEKLADWFGPAAGEGS